MWRVQKTGPVAQTPRGTQPLGENNQHDTTVQQTLLDKIFQSQPGDTEGGSKQLLTVEKQAADGHAYLLIRGGLPDAEMLTHLLAELYNTNAILTKLYPDSQYKLSMFVWTDESVYEVTAGGSQQDDDLLKLQKCQQDDLLKLQKYLFPQIQDASQEPQIQDASQEPQIQDASQEPQIQDAYASQEPQIQDALRELSVNNRGFGVWSGTDSLSSDSSPYSSLNSSPYSSLNSSFQSMNGFHTVFRMPLFQKLLRRSTQSTQSTSVNNKNESEQAKELRLFAEQTVKTYFMENDQQPVDVTDKQWELLEGKLKDMHNLGYAHCDIKTANIMWDKEKGHLVLIDYGEAFHKNDQTMPLDIQEKCIGTNGHFFRFDMLCDATSGNKYPYDSIDTLLAPNKLALAQLYDRYCLRIVRKGKQHLAHAGTQDQYEGREKPPTFMEVHTQYIDYNNANPLWMSELFSEEERPTATLVDENGQKFELRLSDG